MADLDAVPPGLALTLVGAALAATALAACARAGKSFTLAELLAVVALFAVFAALARFGWLHSIGIHVLLLATGFASAMTRVFATRTTIVRHLFSWVTFGLTEIAGAFVILNLIYAATSEPPSDGWHMLFGSLGGVPLLAGILVSCVIATRWPIVWSSSQRRPVRGVSAHCDRMAVRAIHVSAHQLVVIGHLRVADRDGYTTSEIAALECAPCAADATLAVGEWAKRMSPPHVQAHQSLRSPRLRLGFQADQAGDSR